MAPVDMSTVEKRSAEPALGAGSTGGGGTPHALRCRGLAKRYRDVVAVVDVGFDVYPGEAYGLLGPNGAGKTTTLGMLLGLVRCDAGTVEVFGESMAGDTRAARARLGFVPQEIALYPDLTARENLRFFARLYGLSRAAAKTRIGEVLDIVDLADRADERLRTYSGGMQRRVNIAAGLLHEPSLLILDEPTVGVDAQSRNAILTSLQTLVANGLSILYTSHYMSEVEQLCDRVGIIDHGRIIAEGTSRELIAGLGRADRVELVLDGNAEAAVVALRAVPGVAEVALDGGTARLVVQDGGSLLPRLLAAIGEVATVRSVEVVPPDLEAVFLSLTGTALRD